MPRYEDHINQAVRNLNFLQIINKQAPNNLDWQVTVCFYTALHLVNAHLSNYGLQYRSHTDVKDMLNPFNRTSLGRLPEDEYAAYDSLFSHSRRARYLVNKKDDKLMSEDAAYIYEKHLAKSIRHLEKICAFFDAKYDLKLPIISIQCVQLKSQSDFKFFKLIVY